MHLSGGARPYLIACDRFNYFLQTTFSHPFDPRISMDLHEILSSIELLHEHGQFAGTVDQLFYIIEMCASKRPVSWA